MEIKKNPTLKEILQVAQIIKENPAEAILSDKLIDLLVIATGAERQQVEVLPVEEAKRLVSDFFYTWKPLEFISGSMQILTKYIKQSSTSQEGT